MLVLPTSIVRSIRFPYPKEERFLDFTTRSSFAVIGLLLADRLYDLCDHVEFMELWHEVDSRCPGLKLLDQLDRNVYSNFSSIFPSLFDPFASLVGDEDAGHFIMEEIRVSHADQRQDAC